MGLLEAAQNPYLTFEDRSTDPATPTAGSGLLYVKDGVVHSIDDAGTVVEYGSGGGGGGSSLAAARVTRTGQGSNLTTTTSTWADMDSTNLTIDLATGARRVMLMLTAMLNTSSNDLSLGVGFSVDGTAVPPEASLSTGVWAKAIKTGGFDPVVAMYVTDVLTAATHTFRPRWANRSSSGTITALQGSNQYIVFTAVELYA